MGVDVAVSREVIRLLVRPSHVDVDSLDKQAYTFPLDVDECVNVRAVSVFPFMLIVEHSQYRIISWRIPFCGECSVRAYLHLHGVLDHIELQIVSQIQGQHRQRHHFFVGRKLEKQSIVEMELPQCEVFSECGAHYAHRGAVLPCYTLVVIIYVVAKQCVSERRIQSPSRNSQFGHDLGGGYLAETVVPGKVVGVQMLVVIIRFAQVGLEMSLQCQRAVSVLSERIEFKKYIGVDIEIVYLISEEVVFS